MTNHQGTAAIPDPGAFALAVFLRLHGVADAHPDRFKSGAALRLKDMLRRAREFGVVLHACTADWKRLTTACLPAIAVTRAGGFLVLGKMDSNGVVVVRPTSLQPKPELLSRAEFEREWSGDILLRKTSPAAGGNSDAARGGLASRLSLLGADLSRRAGSALAAVGARVQRVLERASPERSATPVVPVAVDENDEGSGVAALVLLLGFHGVGADPAQIRHRLGVARLGVADMLRCAKSLGLKASVCATSWERLPNTPLPAIAALRDGRFLILGKVADDMVLLQRPDADAPETMSRADFEALWDGRLVLMARRTSLVDPHRRFDITWFLGAIQKYRWLLGEVLLASFFLQLFALVSPLFFQVVVDKVLVHHSMSTLDVLIAGLVAVTLFEGLLGALRTYLFSHTTNRIDVELGARLFRHLLALPIAYFQSRRVGDSLTRVRELENIRQFLTSSALTLVIDLLFTFVFLAVMFYYSSTLSWIVVVSLPVYVALSVGASPLFRRRLDEKFRRGAENQAFLVECVTGVETLKAMAVEPQMQRRWEEQLAGYVASSFRVLDLNNKASQAVQTINKLVTAAMLFFGAKLVIDGALTVGELVAFNMLAQPRQRAGVAPGADLAGFPSGAPLDRAAWATFSTPRPSRALRQGASRRPPSAARSASSTSPSAIELDGPAALDDVSLTVRARRSHRHGRPLRLGQEHAGQAAAAALRAGKRTRAGGWGRSRDGRHLPGCAARSAWCCRTTCCSTARSARTSRWPIRPCRWTGSSPPPISPARTSSSWSCPRATTRSSANAAARCRAGSASASPSPARCHRSAHPDLRRGDQRARLRERAGHPAEHEANRGGPHGVRHRAPALHRAPGRPHHHARPRADRGGWRARPAHPPQRAICQTPSNARRRS